MNKKNNKKILIIAATHGNEKIGVQIIKKLQAKKLNKYFNYLIANPKALKKKKEFIDVNLNRVYPGKKKSRLLEERLAYKNLQIAKKYRYIIDIHEANKGRDNFIIVPREKVSRSFPLRFVDLKKVILWPDPKGPISQVLEYAIELEFGTRNKNRKIIIDKAIKIVEKFIMAVNLKKYPAKFSKKEIYYVYGKLLADKNTEPWINLKDFKETKINKEKFYPLLVGQYMNLGMICYKMKKIFNNDKLSNSN